METNRTAALRNEYRAIRSRCGLRDSSFDIGCREYIAARSLETTGDNFVLAAKHVLEGYIINEGYDGEDPYQPDEPGDLDCFGASQAERDWRANRAAQRHPSNYLR